MAWFYNMCRPRCMISGNGWARVDRVYKPEERVGLLACTRLGRVKGTFPKGRSPRKKKGEGKDALQPLATGTKEKGGNSRLLS